MAATTELTNVSLDLHPTVRACWRDVYIQDIEPITEAAFKEAQVQIRAEIDQPADRLWLERQHSVKDVFTLLKCAKDIYESKKQSKARRWLTALSGRVLHFSNVLDVFAQHHPEYVALVWGSFKFLFTLVLNHEKIIKELCKSICQIADVLPRAEIALLLYPTARMRAAVAHTYKHILRFAQKAVAWYSKGALARGLQSVANPWELQFEEELVAVQEQSRNIEAEASTASRAELREAHMQIYKLQAQLTEMTSIVSQTNLTVLTQLLPLQETQSDMIHAVILNQVLSSGPLQQLPVSGTCLEFCMSFRRRRQNRTNYDLPQITRLSQWASDEKTRVLVARGGDTKLSRDFLVDLITLIRTSQKPVIFALRFPDYRDQTLTFTMLIQMLVAQALQMNERNFGALRHVLSPARLQEASGEEEWLRILNEALRGLPYVFIVLDADLLNYAVSYSRYHASKSITAIHRIVTSTVLKVFVSSFSVDTSTLGFNLDDDVWEIIETGASKRRAANHLRSSIQKSASRRYRARR